MKPSVQKIITKLAKEKENKVELSVPEILRFAQEVEELWKNANKSINIEGKKMIDRVVQDVKPMNEAIQKLRKEIEDFERKAEALGLDRKTIDNEIRKGQQALKGGFKQSQDLTRRIAEIRNAIF
jgi:uncharacterized protein YoxC